MKQFILTQFPLTWMPVLALVIFFAFFVGLLIQVSLKARQPIFREASNVPLDEAPKYEAQNE